jgi:malonyl-CoA decarboxylase
MVIEYNTEGFNPEWLAFLNSDPVHQGISIQKRVTGNRTVFVYLHEQIPQFMVCVRIGNKLPQNMAEILNDDGYSSKYDVTYAIFYSIFRLPGATLHGAGTLAIKELIAHCRLKNIHNFYTLSPTPLLRDHFSHKPDDAAVRKYLASWHGPVAKFHLSNGARIHSINFDADYSEQRQNESWGIMVNYDYNG